jgi:hypothetical protein
MDVPPSELAPLGHGCAATRSPLPSRTAMTAASSPPSSLLWGRRVVAGRRDVVVPCTRREKEEQGCGAGWKEEHRGCSREEEHGWQRMVGGCLAEGG